MTLPEGHPAWRNSEHPLWLEPAQRTCGSCRWHDVAGLYRQAPKFAEGLGNVGYCRFDPPQIPQWMGPLPLEISGEWPTTEDQAFTATWPLTREADWCGRWLEDTRSHFERFGIPAPSQEAATP